MTPNSLAKFRDARRDEVQNVEKTFASCGAVLGHHKDLKET
jgi:hypothetical protein